VPAKSRVLSLLGNPAVRVGLAGLLLAALVFSGRLNFRVFASLRPGPGLWAVAAATAVAFTATSFRWLALVRAAGRHGSVAALAGVALGSSALTYLSPAGAGTDVARALHLVVSGKVGRAEAAAISVADRLLGIQCLLLLAAGVGCWAAADSGYLPLALVLGAASLGGLLAAAALFKFADRLPQRGLPGRWRGYVEGLRGRMRPGWLAAAWLASALAAVANGLLPWLALGAFQWVDLTPQVMLASILVVFVNAAAPTPGGIGAGEAAASALFSAAGPGAPAMLLVRTMGALVSLLLATPWLLSGRRAAPAETAA
jgi:uncharacterized membrane protein YbhN (UPF0104 family)